MKRGYFRWSFLCYLFSILSAKALSSMECTFEEGFCDWKDANNTWERINADNESETRLRLARRNNDGYYIAISNPTESATLSSSTLLLGRACVSLWYSLSRGKNYTIKVKFSNSRRREQTILKDRETDVWKHVSVNMNPLTNYQVQIEGIVKDNDGYIAVDDTKITTGITCSADCNFDHGWCAWKQEGGNSAKWTRHRSGSSGGPLSDHTSGYGYYIFHQRIGTNSSLSVSQKGDGDICLTLWYFIHGDNSINVYVKTHAETKRLEDTVHEGDGEGKWNKVQIQFFQQNAYQMIIEGVIANGSTGDISIDDVNVRQGVCEQAEEKIKEEEEGERASSMIIVYVVVPLAIGALIVIGVIAFILWRRTKGKLSKESNFHSSPSFSNNAYMGHQSKPSNQRKSFTDDSDYAVIGDENINMSTDKAEYNVLNTKSKDQQELEFDYDRLKTPFDDKSYSHVSHTNEDIVIQTSEKKSNDRNEYTVITPIDKSIVPIFQFETENDKAIDYDHAQSGAEDSRKSDDKSRLHNEGIINHNLNKGKMSPANETHQNKTQETLVADDNFASNEEDNSKVHDYYILQKEET